MQLAKTVNFAKAPRLSSANLSQTKTTRRVMKNFMPAKLLNTPVPKSNKSNMCLLRLAFNLGILGKSVMGEC